MSTVPSFICTVFEGDYHYGVAALVNSLSKNGFDGAFYAGYRGKLPPWANPSVNHGTAEMRLQNGMRVHFIPLDTDLHLCNYKPEFMLNVWDRECPEAEAGFYFDPDIVVLCRWGFFEEWVLGGVALCADATPELPPTHPLRHAWRRYFEAHGEKLDREQSFYINSGFVGLRREQRAFLESWRKMIHLSRPAAGDLKYINLGDPTILFSIPDQDCLNAATMSSTEPISCMGRDGMSFLGGGHVMSHAIGTPKPWQKRPLWDAFRRGQRPTHTDRIFLDHVSSPIPAYSPSRLSDLYRQIRLARFVAKAHIG